MYVPLARNSLHMYINVHDEHERVELYVDVHEYTCTCRYYHASTLRDPATDLSLTILCRRGYNQTCTCEL